MWAPKKIFSPGKYQVEECWWSAYNSGVLALYVYIQYILFISRTNEKGPGDYRGHVQTSHRKHASSHHEYFLSD